MGRICSTNKKWKTYKHYSQGALREGSKLEDKGVNGNSIKMWRQYVNWTDLFQNKTNYWNTKMNIPFYKNQNISWSATQLLTPHRVS